MLQADVYLEIQRGFCQSSEDDGAWKLPMESTFENEPPDEECPMNGPHCTSPSAKEQRKKTILGYRTFRWRACKPLLNERTGTPFNLLEYPTDIVLLVVVRRLRYKLSLRDGAEMFLERGWSFTHETVRDWETRFAPLLADQLRVKRRGQAAISWHVDETSVRVQGKWCSWYCAIDQDGNLVDSMLSQKRDRDAAKRFFQQALQTTGQAPERVITDRHRSYPRAIREIPGNDVLHRCNHSLNNLLEQEHRGLKQRYDPMRGFGSFTSASRFCRAFDARASVVPDAYDHEAIRLPATATRDVSPAMSGSAGSGAGGLTDRNGWEEKPPTRFVCFLCSQF